MNILPYIRVARPDHWFKNIFVVPGILLAFYFAPNLFSVETFFRIIAGVICAYLIASSNYVLNEILDAPTDRLHPLKFTRPIPGGQVNIGIAYLLWMVLAVAGIGSAFLNPIRLALGWFSAGLLAPPPPAHEMM